MAGITRRDLDRWHALGANAPRIVLGCEVTLDDEDAVLRPQPANGGFEQ